MKAQLKKSLKSCKKNILTRNKMKFQFIFFKNSLLGNYSIVVLKLITHEYKFTD